MIIYSIVLLPALRVEWAKAKARAERWEEEVVLLNEEMRRVLMYCSWKEEWWREQLKDRVVTLDVDDPLAEGLKAYAYRQSALESRIRSQWQAKWHAARNGAKAIIDEVMGSDWISLSGDDTAALPATSIDNLITQVIELDIGDIGEDGGEERSGTDF